MIVYLLLINLISFLLFGYDKMQAKAGKARIPESNLFLVTLAGGGIGSWIGMKWFRHKTLHMNFVIGIPAIAIIETLIIISFLILI